MTSSRLKKNNPGKEPESYLAVCSLASGSKGNAVYISDGDTSILVDAGLSGIEIERRLKSKGIHPNGLDAVIVSHEHIDHVKGVGVLSRRYNLPIYISKKTKAAATPLIGNIKDTRSFSCGRTFNINRLTIHPFSVSHDAEDPVGFTISRKDIKIGLATDLGIATALVKEHLKGCALLLLEANHDTTMLQNGPYPWAVKQRIKSRTGHLSNEESKALLMELKHNHLRHVILGHLSETNNTPEKAIRHVGPALAGCKAKLKVVTQDRCGELVYLR